MHQVWFYVVARFAGAADHDHIQIAVKLQIEFGTLQGKSVIFRKKQVIVRVFPVLKRHALFFRSPSRGTAFFACSVISHKRDIPQPYQPYSQKYRTPAQHCCRLLRKIRRVSSDSGDKGAERCTIVFKEAAPGICDDPTVSVP